MESSIYSDQNYWEDRYGSLNDDGKGENADVYEWYASYKEIRDHIKEDVHSTRINIADVEFLVSGCGNSTLCEELYHDGNPMFIIIR